MKVSSKSLALSVFASLSAFLVPQAQAGCGPAEGLMQVCYRDRCEVQKLVRQCSSVVAGNHYESDLGWFYGYSEYIGGYATQMIVRFEPHNKILYQGHPEDSPYTFDICGGRMTGGPCSEKPWAK